MARKLPKRSKVRLLTRCLCALEATGPIAALEKPLLAVPEKRQLLEIPFAPAHDCNVSARRPARSSLS